MNNTIVEKRKCALCSNNFPIYQEDKEFYDKISPSFNGEKFQIPFPTLCPDCRQKRRLAWRNDRKLYKRKCDATGKEVISVFSPDKPFRVYDSEFWWSDLWNIEMSQHDFDFSRDFFSQFSDLFQKIPKRALVKGTGSTNCNYANLVGASQNGYLVFNGTNSRDCMYIDAMSDIDSCVDCSQVRNSSNCYEGIDIINCNSCFYIQDCTDCSFSQYLFDCINCEFCFGCVGLRNKKYYIFNKAYSKDKYKEELESIIKKGFTRKEFYDWSLKYPRKHLKIIGSNNATGDMIYNSSNVNSSYEIYDAQDISYGVNIYRGAHDCVDVNVGLNNSNHLYEVSLANKNCSNMLFCHDCWNCCENLIYCAECKLTKNCFGCTGLVGKEYCILNKQYSKEEYQKIVAKIIKHIKQTGEWGEFFPISLSPFGYNETMAHEFYPLSETLAQNIGGRWSYYEAPFPKVEKVISAKEIPINISDIPDDILNWAIECEVTKKPFRIISQELKFYRKHSISIPKRHPDERYQNRKSLRTPRQLYKRECCKCTEKISTAYSSKRLEKIYCENCYNKEIY